MPSFSKVSSSNVFTRPFKKNVVAIFLILSLWSLNTQIQAESSLSFLDPVFIKSQYTSLLIKTEQGIVLAQKDADRFLVPASTTKLATAFLALTHWGENHHFKTEFYLEGLERLEGKPTLVIKGYGDPFLVSEEIKLLSKNISSILASRGITKISNIKLDTSHYIKDLKLPGTGRSNNPYDAIPSALAANFNTVFIKNNSGTIQSAELQTPLTPTASSFGENLSNQKLRVNTGLNVRTGEQNFAELLRIFLQKQGLEVGKEVVWQAVRDDSSLLYRHYNSKNLAEMIYPMMRYSTNFIANQLALNLSAEIIGVPASSAKVSQLYRQQLSYLLGWEDAFLEEGAGLSRENKLTARQLVGLLEAFKPWKHLLPEIEKNIFAKSGTLIGVSTLAGYIKNEAEYYPFAIMINQKMPFRYRNKIAIQLREFIQ